MIRKFKLAFLFFALFALLILSGCATNPYFGYGSYKTAAPRGNVGLGVGIDLGR